MKLKTILMACVSLLLVACGEGATVIPNDNGHTSLRRHIDDEAGVVCYWVVGGSAVDCMPISETKLKR